MAKKQETLTLFPEVLVATRKLTNEQFGILMRAAFEYRFSGTEYSSDDPAIDTAFQFVASQIDRYRDICDTKAKAAKDRWDARRAEEIDAKGTNGCTSMHNVQSDAPIHSSPIHSSPIQSFPIPSGSKESKADKPPMRSKPDRKSFGEFGWVKLTDDEYNRLINDFGEAEVNRCIAYVDESAQSTGNKNKWKDWNLVVRKCHNQGWGLSQRQQQRNIGGRESGIDRLARMYKEEFGE